MPSPKRLAANVRLYLPLLAILGVLAPTRFLVAQDAVALPSPSDVFAKTLAKMVSAETSEPKKRILPELIDGSFKLPALGAPSTSTEDVGRVPPGIRSDDGSPEVQLPENANDRGFDWDWAVSNWAAANTFSYPRYFEDRMLERHGHERCPTLQPFVSGARFFATVPMMPYLMTVSPACECEYTVGFYRSGSCAPVMCQRPPWERRAVIAETAAIATAIIAFP